MQVESGIEFGLLGDQVLCGPKLQMSVLLPGIGNV
jgi:hypothetical protein